MRFSPALPILFFGWTSGLSAFDHGPLVQWSEKPESSAHLLWLQEGGIEAIEGEWAAGPGGFGYGDGDDRTVFPRMRGNYTSVVIRQEVEVPAGSEGDEWVLEVNYDDAWVAWWDGVEIGRRGVRGEEGGYRVTGKREAGKYEGVKVAAGVIRAGKGKLAVMGLNDSKTSSDFSLAVRLVRRGGGKTQVVVKPESTWEYLAGKAPEEGWQKGWAGVKPVQRKLRQVGAIDFRQKGESEWKRAAVAYRSFAGTEHRVCEAVLSGLKPGEEVEVRAWEGAKVERFRTASATVAGLKFVTGGDLYHDYEPMNRMNRRAGLEDPAFALLGGDLAYTNNANPERWFQFVDSWVEHARTPDGRLVPMVVAIGNHEVVGAGYRPKDAPGPEHATEFFSLFRMQEEGEARQVVDFGKELSLVLLDSGHSATVASQNGWLEKVLAERQEVKRLFVCYHRPAWGCGAKDDAVDIQREWCPLFDRYRVDGVFENDHHTYCRTYPLKGGKVDEVEGIPYLGSGAWSVGVRSLDAAKLKARPWVARAEAKNHLYVVEFGEEGWKAEAMSFDGKAFDSLERAWRRGD